MLAANSSSRPSDLGGSRSAARWAGRQVRGRRHRAPDGATFYWQAIKGKTLYSLPTVALTGWLTAAALPDALTDRSLAGKIETIGENGPADGLIISRHDGRMYVSSPQDDAIWVRDLLSKGSPLIVVRIPTSAGPTPSPRDRMAPSTSRLADQDSAFLKEGAPIALPKELWSLKPR